MALRVVRLCSYENRHSHHLIHQDETGLLAWCQSCHRVEALNGDSASAYRSAMNALRRFPPIVPGLMRNWDE